MFYHSGVVLELQKDEHLSMPHPEEPSVSHFAHRPFTYQRTVKGPISHHTSGSVGMPAACRALCGLLCLTLWARLERAKRYKVPQVPGCNSFSTGVQIAVFDINYTLFTLIIRSYTLLVVPYRSFYECTTVVADTYQVRT